MPWSNVFGGTGDVGFPVSRFQIMCISTSRGSSEDQWTNNISSCHLAGENRIQGEIVSCLLLISDALISRPVWRLCSLSSSIILHPVGTIGQMNRTRSLKQTVTQRVANSGFLNNGSLRAHPGSRVGPANQSKSSYPHLNPKGRMCSSVCN